MSIESPLSNRLDPLPERIGRNIFTDREEELASLMQWADTVARKFGRSLALVSPRRQGKTAILERFYNRIFWERNDVVPFYFELKEDKKWFRAFAYDYYFSFLRQFLAYQTRNPSIAFAREIEFDEVMQLAIEAGEEMVQTSLKRLASRMASATAHEIFDVAQTVPQSYAYRTGLSVIVIFDEFQRLDEVLYEDEACIRKSHPKTGSYSSAVESSLAPMLIAGSQVTMLTRRALGGGMAGRVSRMRVNRLPMDGGAELARKLASRSGFDLPLTLAYTISRLTKGHPYYIWALFHSRMMGRDLRSEAGIKEVLAFEVEDPLGHINEFWRDHCFAKYGGSQ